MVITVLWPRSTLVVVGGGDIAESLQRIAALLGWNAVDLRRCQRSSGDSSPAWRRSTASSFSATTSSWSAGRWWQLSRAEVGYVGAVGAKRLQETRADWLAYRGFTDRSRIHGPAGMDIGARNPRGGRAGDRCGDRGDADGSASRDSAISTGRDHSGRGRISCRSSPRSRHEPQGDAR